MLHSMLEGVSPRFAITDAKAEALAEAWAGYLQHTSLGGVVDPKTRALLTMITITWIVEGPMIRGALADRKAAREAARITAAAEAQAGGRVVPLQQR
jgi:hypothetical protein